MDYTLATTIGTGKYTFKCQGKVKLPFLVLFPFPFFSLIFLGTSFILFSFPFPFGIKTIGVCFTSIRLHYNRNLNNMGVSIEYQRNKYRGLNSSIYKRRSTIHDIKRIKKGNSFKKVLRDVFPTVSTPPNRERISIEIKDFYKVYSLFCSSDPPQ